MTTPDPYAGLRFSGPLASTAYDCTIEVREDGQCVIAVAPLDADGSIAYDRGTEFSSGTVAGALTVLAAWVEANR